MIEFCCCSEKKLTVPESAVGKKIRCPACGRALQIISGEPLAEGAGVGDFDAALVADEGSTLPVGRYVIGGVAEISIGKAPECTIVLPGKMVSRRHCTLVRVDFGPSRWKIADQKSTNGLFVNGQRVTEHELADGDAIRIGEFGFTYRIEVAEDNSLEILEQTMPQGDVMSHAPVVQSQVPSGRNGMAIAGLVMGILICVPLFNLLAIIFSAIGLSRASRQGGRGQAIAGLTLGIVGILVTPMSCAILLPALNRAREQANRIKCQSNMKQIGLAISMYENSNHGAFPSSLDVLVSAENLPPQALTCPDAPGGQSESYVLVPRGHDGGTGVEAYEPISNHHDGANFLYTDGHAVFMPNPAAEQLVEAITNAIANAPDVPAETPTIQQPIAPPNPFAVAPPGSGNAGVPPADDSGELPAGAVKTAMVGGNGGSPYVRVDQEKRPVIGFRISIGEWNGHPTIGHCDPLWAAPADAASTDAALCLARDGYVVGGIVVNDIDDADGLQVLFMKVTDGGVDVNDSYKSTWFGATSGAAATQLAGNGERVIGTFGRQGLNNDALGLVVEPQGASK